MEIGVQGFGDEGLGFRLQEFSLGGVFISGGFKV